MSRRLSDTVALVTGASSGIGEATALALAEQGAGVALIARRKDRIDALASRIGDSGGAALAIECDVSNENEAHSAVAAAVDRFGRLDTVIANAGVMLLGNIGESPTEEWRRMMEVNVLGLMYTARASLPHLIEAAGHEPRNVSDLVLISSVAGRAVRLGSGVYNASKHAVGAFGESLRQEVTKRHVRVSLVEPGAVSTELGSHNRPEIQARLRERFADLERLEADDIARTVTFIVTQPRHVAINEVLIRPTEQEQ